MTIINGSKLLALRPLEPMVESKMRAHGVSRGLAEAGYDIAIKQDVRFTPPDPIAFAEAVSQMDTSWPPTLQGVLGFFHGTVEVDGVRTLGRFCLASSVERFTVPRNLVAVMGHKSSWARRGVNVWAGTTAESGWEGWLTLEIGFHGLEPVHIPAGSGIAQVHFHELAEPGDYGSGKYANQPDEPVPARMA